MSSLRIISTVPSQTELLFDLGLDDSIIGVTWFCIHPREKCKARAQIGGTKNLNLEKILELQPTLILANKEENEKAQIEFLAQHCKTWVSDIKALDDALDMMRTVGSLTGTVAKAEKIIEKTGTSFKNLPQAPPLRTLYLIWRKPWMSIGHDTFIHDMLSRLGLVNVLAGVGRYPELTDEMIKNLDPELILLSSEPYPFKEKHISGLQILLPRARIMLVDGEMFSWYGTRLIAAAEYFKGLKF